MRRAARWMLAVAALAACGLPVPARAVGAPPAGDDAAHPWPSFRHDLRNTGRSVAPPRPDDGAPWSFATGKGIFSTPVIDRDGSIYVGSADRFLYALDAAGRERWRFETGEIVDSAGVLGPPLPGHADPTFTFGSGDGVVRQLRTADGLAPEARLVWQFDARSAPGPGFNHWFEGNVVRTPDGGFLAGNTNFRYYALASDGRLAWHYTTGSNAWSAASLDGDGTVYWGSLDGFLHAVAAGGALRWRAPSLGFIAASAAIGRDDTVYVGSFDGSVRAYAGGGRAWPWPLPRWRLATWRFATRDHVYGSPALREDAEGRTLGVYVTSTDGALYALSPDGALRWRHDVGDPIRSSPVIGPAPEGGGRETVYFGAGDGRLYAVDADTGERRWSFDTTPDDPELRDRNDLNASPALGPHGVAIGGEHGRLWHVPYRHCLRTSDPRCEGPEAAAAPPDGARLVWLTPGGSALARPPDPVPAAGVVTLRLEVRRGGEVVDAAFCASRWRCGDAALAVDFEPPLPHDLALSADGRHLHLVPRAALPPAAALRLRIRGAWLEERWRVGSLAFGGREAGTVDETLELRSEPAEASDFPLGVGEDAVGAVAWRRLAVPLPTMMPSLNQIGFDSYDWALSLLARTPSDAAGQGRLLAWAVGLRPAADGRSVVDPLTDFAFPLAGSFDRERFVLANRAFTLRVTDVPIPFQRFELRGALGVDGRVRPGASAWAESACLSIPNYGPRMVLGGLCSGLWRRLVTSGTFVTRALHPDTTVHRRPAGVGVAALEHEPATAERAGSLRATLAVDAAAPDRAGHRVDLVLFDPATLEPLPLGEGAALETAADAGGAPAHVRLVLPPGTRLPPGAEVIVVWDAFPLHRAAVPAPEAASGL